MHFGRQVFADIPEMPGFRAVAGDVCKIGLVAQNEAVFIGVGGDPLAAGCGRETISDIAAAAAKIHRPAGLMLTVAWPRAFGVRNRLAICADFVVVNRNLCGVRTITALRGDDETRPFCVRQHGGEGLRGLRAHELPVANRRQIGRSVRLRIERVLLINNNPYARGIGRAVGLLVERRLSHAALLCLLRRMRRRRDLDMDKNSNPGEYDKGGYNKNEEPFTHIVPTILRIVPCRQGYILSSGIFLVYSQGKMQKNGKVVADYIVPLDMNGLSGRMLQMPAPKGKTTEILFVYGQHSSLERWWGLLKYANRFGAVTAPDLPGFGGMESFYKIGQRPTVDNFADYLAAFIKMRYKRKKVVIMGMSLGFVIAARMLQRYPELRKSVALLVSLAGMTHRDDFRFPKARYWFYRSIGFVFARWPAAFFFRHVFLNAWVLRMTYAHTYQARSKFAAAKNRTEHDMFMDVEVDLWHRNDVRTHAVTLSELLTLDNCRVRLDVPVWHVTVDGDQYLDHRRVAQHMQVAFSNVRFASSHVKHHAPSIIADEKAAAPLIPAKLRRALSSLG